MIDKTIPLEETIEPFRQDNSRLMVENNDLHKNISFLREKMVETAGNQQQKARKIQNENSDLRFLNSQYFPSLPLRLFINIEVQRHFCVHIVGSL